MPDRRGAGLAASAAAMDGLQPQRIAEQWQQFEATDDIVSERYAGFAQAHDLDGDGHDEIVYLATAYCTGSTADCPNTLEVLRRLVPGKGRIVRGDDPYETRARRTGYMPDVGEQIPGEVLSLTVNDARIEVEFVVRADSPICLRRTRGHAAPCPDPGRYRRAYAWAPGRLTRLPGDSHDAVAPRAHFPARLQDDWVVAGTACPQAPAGDPSRTLRFGWDRMHGLGENGWADGIEVLAQSPWTWRILVGRRRHAAPTPAVFVLSEDERRLIVAEPGRVRSYDRCRS
jgi:hypothetical protein